MRGLRTLVSALSLIGGALLIVGGVVSSIVVRSVEDGTALSGMVRTALNVPAVLDEVSVEVQDQAVAALESQGRNLAGAGVEEQVRSVVDAAVRSPLFAQAFQAAADDASTQFSQALTAPSREPAPLTVTVEVSQAVNARIDDLPAVGARVPDVTLPAVTIDVMSAATFEHVRDAYRWANRLADVGVWAGVALLVVGLAVSHRRRWFASKALLTLAVVALGCGWFISSVDHEIVAGFVPGGATGSVGSLWREIMADDGAARISRTAFIVAAVSLGAALLAFFLGRIAHRR